MRISAEGPAFELPAPAVEPALTPERAGSGAPSAFQKVLARVGTAVDRGEALMASAAAGELGGLDSAQLIALQAGIYRYSEAVDLAAKLVDRATSAVRTVLSPH